MARLVAPLKTISKRPSWRWSLPRLDAKFFSAYTAFSSRPWETGVLQPKIKELIYTAFDASATHMFEPGLRQHIRNAISLGATKEEIVEVLELASVVGAQTWAVAGPPLEEALERAAADSGRGA